MRKSLFKRLAFLIIIIILFTIIISKVTPIEPDKSAMKDVDEYANTIEEELVIKEELEEEIIDIEETSNTEYYTEESLAILQNTLVEANKVLEDRDATQEVVDLTLAALIEAKDNLEFNRLGVEKNLISLPEPGTYDEKEAQGMIDRIMSIDLPILSAWLRNGGEMRLINHNITEEPEYTYLKGEVPRGWDEEAGLTWDDVPGSGDTFLVLARIGHSEPSVSNGHSAICLELHEIAHGLDAGVFNNISQGEEFKALVKDERESMFFDAPWPDYFEYPEEFFAETFTYYYKDEYTKQILKERAPKTYEFMDKLVDYIPE